MKPARGRLVLRPLFRVALALPLLASSVAYGRKEPQGPPFSYVAGTEAIPAGCGGTLALTSKELVFQCAPHSITVPYAAISLMQYRPDISPKILSMKLQWKIRPAPASGRKGRKNKYFTVVFDQAGSTHVAVFEVEPQTMIGYLAEIDLKTGKRVEVWGYEDNGE